MDNTAPPPADMPPPAAPVATTSTGSAGWPNLNAGGLMVYGNITVSMSKELVGKPITIAPDVYYGVNDQLTVGLVHQPGFIANYGGGICANGKKKTAGVEIDYCGKTYNNVGAEALYALMNGATSLSAQAGFHMADIDNSIMQLHLGVAGRWGSGNLGIFFNPMLAIGLNKRDGAKDPTTGATVGGNKEHIMIPVRVAFQATPVLSPFLDTGIGGPLDGFGDAYGVPLGIGALFGASPNLSVGAEFLFPEVAGGADVPKGASRTDMRVLNLFINWTK